MKNANMLPMNPCSKGVRRLLIPVLFLLLVQCSNDDDKGPVTGYFVKKIETAPGTESIRVEFEYDDHNRMTGEKFEISGSLYNFDFNYNDAGLISSIYLNGSLYTRYEYNDRGIVTKLSVTGSTPGVEDEYTLEFLEGTYTIPGPGVKVKVDGQGQLLHNEDLDMLFAHSDTPGAHRHLSPQPARYFGEIGSYTFYDLTFSQQAPATLELTGKHYEFKYTRDERDNIVKVELFEQATGVLFLDWDITYVERSL